MRLSTALIVASLCWTDALAAEPYAPVVPGAPLSFPRDYGSHPAFRTEWWYVTGWLADPQGKPLGFQITFFRTRPEIDTDNPSKFTARQILIAHCALSDPKRGQLYQDQRVRREGLGLAEAEQGDTNVSLEGWSLVRGSDGYNARIDAVGFSIDLRLHDSQAPLINGDGGYSRKGPATASASYYYSLPHVQVSGRVVREGHTDSVSGEAWFDHEWSSEYLDPKAAGWEWTGINLNDGGALMAFQIRGTDGNRLWAGGTLRRPDGSVHLFTPDEIELQPQREWTSPRTAVRYPVEWALTAGGQHFELRPLMDDQENDTRLSTGAIYWEGAVELRNNLRVAGRGYLELTGYGTALKLP